MSRIAGVGFEGAELSSSVQVGANRAELVQADLAAIMGHRPEHAAAIAQLNEKVQHGGSLGGRLIELVRLRIAFHNQCRSCMAVRYSEEVTDEGLVCSLERPEEAPDLTEAERAALRFADLFANDHLAIEEAEYDALRMHFTEPELVELGILCAYAVGFGRLAATWHVVDHVPDGFKSETAGGAPVTPWGQAESIDATTSGILQPTAATSSSRAAVGRA